MRETHIRYVTRTSSNFEKEQESYENEYVNERDEGAVNELVKCILPSFEENVELTMNGNSVTLINGHGESRYQFLSSSPSTG